MILSVGPLQRGLVVAFSVPVGAYTGVFHVCYILFEPSSEYVVFHGYVPEFWFSMDEFTFISQKLLSRYYTLLFKCYIVLFIPGGREVIVHSCIYTFLRFVAAEFAFRS